MAYGTQQNYFSFVRALVQSFYFLHFFFVDKFYRVGVVSRTCVAIVTASLNVLEAKFYGFNFFFLKNEIPLVISSYHLSFEIVHTEDNAYFLL